VVIKVTRTYPNLVRERTRHGKECYYFRPWHGPRIRIHATPGTDEFERHYLALTSEPARAQRRKPPRDTPTENTLRWLGTKYTASAEFRALEPPSQRNAKRVLESIYLEPINPRSPQLFGDCPLRKFDATAVGILRDRKANAGFPGAGNDRVKKVSAMYAWALLPTNAKLGVTSNPARDVGKLKKGKGHPQWTPDDLDKFERRHPIGSKARLALALLMFTGARRSDVVRLGPPMVRVGELTWLPFKGRNRENAVEVCLPNIAELLAIIVATPIVGTTTWLVTQYGRPFTKEGFGNKMADWCREAGIADKNSPGVRKAAATRMAERGASTHTLMHVFGWLDIRQAELYTRDAERKRLSRENAHLLGTNG